MNARLVCALLALSCACGSEATLVNSTEFSTLATNALGTPVSGTLDLATNASCQVDGWARDANAAGQGVWVTIYADAPYGMTGSRFVTGVSANLLRADLPFTDKNHGFSLQLFDTAIADGHPHPLYVYGSAISPSSSGALLAGTPKTITCSISVLAFGAKGTGTVDDAPAIRAAIAAADSAGGTVYFPSGTYLLGSADPTAGTLVGTYPNGNPIATALLVRGANVALVGASNPRPTLVLAAHTKQRMLSASKTASNLTLKNLIFDGNKQNRDAGTGWPSADVVDGLIMNWVNTGIAVSNLESRNGIEDGFGCWKCNSLTIQDSYFHDNGTPAAGSQGIASSGMNATFIRNVIKNNFGSGIWLAYGVNTVTVGGSQTSLGNIISGNTGAAIDIGGQPVLDSTGMNVIPGGFDVGVTIANNTLTSNGSAGYTAIWVNQAKDSVIIANQVIDNQYGGLKLNAGSVNWSVTNNTFASSSSAHLQARGIITMPGVSSINLAGNTCSRNGSKLGDQIEVHLPNGAIDDGVSTPRPFTGVNTTWATVNTRSWW